MNKMKHLLLVGALALVLLLGLAACNSGNGNDNDTRDAGTAADRDRDRDRDDDRNDRDEVVRDGNDDNNDDANNDTDDTPIEPVGAVYDSLDGTFVMEDDPSFSIMFYRNYFLIPVSTEMMGLPELDGYFFFEGTFAINEAARRITFTIDEEALLFDMIVMVWELLEMDPDMAELLHDPEWEEFIDMLIDAMVEEYLLPVVDEVVWELSDLALYFEPGFARLYSEYGEIFVRQ